MKSFLLVLKIGALLAVIFAAGVWVGRNSIPAKETKNDVVSHAGVASGEHDSGRWVVAYQRYAKALDFTAEQQAQLKPLFKETDELLAGIPRLSQERQRIVEALHQRMEPHLNPQQKVEAMKIRQQGIELLEKARTGK